MGNEDSPKRRQNLIPSPRRIGPQFQLRPQWWNWAGLKRAVDERIQRQGTTRLETHAVVGMRYFWIDGVFASLSDNILLSFVSVFVLAYGATNGQIGLLNAIGNLLGVIALVPGATHADRTRNRKRLVLWTGGGLGRAAIVLMVLVPFFAPGAQFAIWAVIIVNAVRSFLNNYANPAWTGIVADLVPVNRRGRYFSDRNVAMGISGMAALWAAGFIIPRLNGVRGLPHLGYQVVFLVALVFGVASTISFARIPDTPAPAAFRASSGWNHLLAALKHHRNFVAFLAGALVWNLSIQIAAPFFNVYIINGLGGTAESVGGTAAVMTICGLGGSLVFGRQADRRGSLSVVRLCGLLIPLLPALWAISTSLWQIYIFTALGGFVWAGYNLANFNLLLELAPAEHRSRAVALYQVVVFASAVAGPALGGWLVDLFSYRLVFAVTSVGRLAGILVFLVLLRGRDGGGQSGSAGGEAPDNAPSADVNSGSG